MAHTVPGVSMWTEQKTFGNESGARRMAREVAYAAGNAEQWLPCGIPTGGWQ